MANFNKVCAVILVFSCMIATGSCARECYRQLCKECPAEEADSGDMQPTRCEVTDLIDTTWLDENTKAIPIPQNEEVNFACITMVASNSHTINSTDVIRGCVLRSNAENMCNLLTGIERARDKNFTSCMIYNRNLGNGVF